MATILLVAILLIVVVGFGVLWKLFKSQSSKKDDQSFLLLQNQFNELTRTIDSRLSESSRIMQGQSQVWPKILTEVTEKLTKLDETNRQVVGFADQLQKLQDILKNPKQRGVFGEYYLETLLKNAFSPNQYEMQYKFRDGEIVDAALFFGDKIIPIDSKFSLENYNRLTEEVDPLKKEQLEKSFKSDLKNRIDETSKYIRPQENTMEFAFMFIPAEGIYYDLLVNKVGSMKSNTRDLVEYAMKEKKVYIVSPTTFYVTLQALWQGMRAYQIQESTKDILKNVAMLGKHLKAYQEYFNKLGNNLGSTVNTYTRASKEFQKIDKDILKLTGEAVGIENPVLEKPSELEEIE